jgi:phosphohistidine swiveling domain-containing protein
VDKIFSLLSDCKRYGTLAFSHAARAGFVATTLLNSFVSSGVLADERRLKFLKSFNTVAGDFEKDKASYARSEITLTEITKKYGHLRPGTYEITAKGYWEEPIKCFSNHSITSHDCNEEFTFTAKELAGMGDMLNELGSDISPMDLTEYIKLAIIAREFVKFEFTRNLSLALDYCVVLGEALDIPRSDLSYIEYHDLELLKLNAITEMQFKANLRQRKKDHSLTCHVELPPFIKAETDFHCFERFALQPNFVTNIKVDGLVKCLEGNDDNNLAGMIIMIPQADPGYDWLFGHSIAGLITKYGGANSHMAIRAAEIGLPAAIGVGDKLYEKISNMQYLELDCINQVIREI